MQKTDNVTSRIQSYIEQHCSIPNTPCNTNLFKKRSYRRWAAYEVYNLILDKPFEDANTIIEDFIFLLMAYNTFDHSDQCSMVFHCALETAETLLIYLNQKEE